MTIIDLAAENQQLTDVLVDALVLIEDARTLANSDTTNTDRALAHQVIHAMHEAVMDLHDYVRDSLYVDLIPTLTGGA